MKPPAFESHQAFLRRIQPLTDRHVLRRNGPKAFHLYRQVEAIVRTANLDFLAAILLPLYALAGRPARDPIPLLRSLMVMCHCGESSITQWVYRLAREPILAQLCGIDRLPGVATYYDLFRRIGVTPRTHSVVMRALQRPKGCKKGKKAPPRHPGCVDRILRRLRRHPPRPPFSVWQSILAHIVGQSAQHGLLGPQIRCAVAVDGSPLPSGGNGRGHRVCGCKQQDPCTHPYRRYTDPGARIGWDSYRNRPFYGRHLSAVIATEGGHDLPVYLRLFQGNRHDSVAGAVAFVEAEQLYPQGFARLVADSAFDARPIYSYLDERGTDAVIDLHERDVDTDPRPRRRFPRADRRPRQRRGNDRRPLAVREGIRLDSHGRARCRAGHLMIPRGSSHHGHYTQWRCPLLDHPELECAHPCFYRTHAASLARDPRLQTRIRRGTPEWEAAMDTRTAAERAFSHLKLALGLERGRHRSDGSWIAHTVLAAIAMHLQAWAGVLAPAFAGASTD